jgi:flagellin
MADAFHGGIMGLRINTNVASLNAQRNLVNTTNQLGRSLARLSSGLRIVRAADDAAGLAISERFRAEIRSLGQAQRNALDGVSFLQIAEGALDETSGNLVRLRELAIQAANGSLGDAERMTLNAEFTGLTEEITRVANVTEFNGTAILNNTSTTLTFQIGANNTSNDQISVSSVDATASGIGISGLSISTQSAAQSAITLIDSAINQIASLRGTFGTVQNRLESAIRSLGVSIENTAAAESRIRDVDVASETAILTRNQVLQQAGIAILAQANVSTQSALSLLQ